MKNLLECCVRERAIDLTGATRHWRHGTLPQQVCERWFDVLEAELSDRWHRTVLLYPRVVVQLRNKARVGWWEESCSARFCSCLRTHSWLQSEILRTSLHCVLFQVPKRQRDWQTHGKGHLVNACAHALTDGSGTYLIVCLIQFLGMRMINKLSDSILEDCKATSGLQNPVDFLVKVFNGEEPVHCLRDSHQIHAVVCSRKIVKTGHSVSKEAQVKTHACRLFVLMQGVEH